MKNTIKIRKTAYDVLNSSEYNTNNAWGFGGIHGKSHVIYKDDSRELRIIKGHACFRHANSEPRVYYRVYVSRWGFPKYEKLSDVSKQIFDRYLRMLQSKKP